MFVEVGNVISKQIFIKPLKVKVAGLKPVRLTDFYMMASLGFNG